jgi:hypothetical protein
LPAEEPGLGVQAGGAGLVADLDLGAAPHQLVDRPALGGADVGRGDDPERFSVTAVPVDGVDDQPEALPLDERAQQVDPVGGGDLGGELLVEGRLAAGVDKEVCTSQRVPGTVGGWADGVQHLGRFGDEVFARGLAGLFDEAFEDTVGYCQAAL